MIINLKALTPKGREILTEKEQIKTLKLAMKIMGMTREIINEDPYTIKITIAKLPRNVRDRPDILKSSYSDLIAKRGGTVGIDVDIKVTGGGK